MKSGTYPLALAAFLAAPALTHAATVSGLTFAAASPGGNQSLASHFHSESGLAEVGNLEDIPGFEEIRALSEVDLSGLAAASSATLRFDLFDDAGLFDENDFAYLGPIDILACGADNAAELAYFGAVATGTGGSFSTAGLSVGETLSFDVTALYNAAIGAGDSALGIRLQIAGTDNGGAYTFDAFDLGTGDATGSTDPGGPTDPTGPTSPSPVPLPASAALLLGALRGLGGLRRKSA